MFPNTVFTYKLKRNIYNLGVTIFIISPYKFKRNRPDIFKTAPSVWMVKVYLLIGRPVFENWLEPGVNKCMYHPSLMKMFVRIENYQSHYLGYRSWMLCRLRQKESKPKRQHKSLILTVWTCLIVRYDNGA